VAVGAAAAASKEISMEEFAGGLVYIPAAADGLTSIAYWTATEAGGTYFAMYDEDGVAVSQTVSHSKAYALPAALFGCRFVKLVGNEAHTVDVHLKT
jgi:hypothetical protein